MKNTLYFLSIQIFIIFLWFIGSYIVYCFVPTEDLSNFSNLFNVINSLFTALAFGGVIYSIIIQTHELLLTREEFSKSVEAQTTSSNALTQQLEIQRKVVMVSAISEILKQYDENKHLNFKEENTIKKIEYIKMIEELLEEIKSDKHS